MPDAIIVFSDSLGKILEHPSDVCAAVGDEITFDCRTCGPGDLIWHRNFGGIFNRIAIDNAVLKSGYKVEYSEDDSNQLKSSRLIVTATSAFVENQHNFFCTKENAVSRKATVTMQGDYSLRVETEERLAYILIVKG